MTIAVALSGGVDSACAALLLKEEGHNVICLHMKLMPGDLKSWSNAKSVADAIGVPIHLVDLTGPFREHIIDHFISEYASGRTPSPCPRCNRKIKMALLLEHAFELGADKLATGHYARIFHAKDRLTLLKGLDRSKDQSYFLFMLNQFLLSKMCFPLGELTKTEVRNISSKHNLPVSLTEESQELCFIPNAMYTDFLMAHGLEAKPGLIVDLDGRVRGKHKGIAFYTVGQRRGLGVCGKEPSYVIEIDPLENKIVMGKKDSTFVSGIILNQLNFISGNQPDQGKQFWIKLRSTSTEIHCVVEEIQADFLRIFFETPQSAVSPGQAAVLYDGDEVIGGGWIQQSFRYELHDHF